VEALEPAHEERGNGERATVGGADGGGKKQRRRSPGVDDEDAIGDTSAAVEDPVLTSLPSMVRGT
jgi:hypothetical protein